MRKTMAGKNASSELKAICCERPMQSSAMNCRNVRLKTAIHSSRRRRSGPEGARPSPAGASVAVANGEAAETGLRSALPAAAHEQSHGRADAAREDEPDAEGTRRDDRQLRAQLGADVGRLVDLRAKRVDGAGQLVALALDLQADLFGGAAVTGHCSSTRSVVSFAS